VSKPFTRRQLEEALHAAVLGLRSLDGMSGTVEKRASLIKPAPTSGGRLQCKMARDLRALWT